MRISATEVEKNRLTHIYIYADDLSQKAYRGQAEVFAWYPSHCFPVFTRIWCCADNQAQFITWSLSMFKEIMEARSFQPIRLAIERNPHKHLIILPKIGEGCSGLRYKASGHYKIISDFLESIKK